MVGALAVGGLIGLGVLGGSFAVALTSFAFLSLLAWIAMRLTLGKRRNATKTFNKDVNDG
jgi:membrane protein implicated in regulation of membrane protease activity